MAGKQNPLTEEGPSPEGFSSITIYGSILERYLSTSPEGKLFCFAEG
jgi:hypothetical protein